MFVVMVSYNSKKDNIYCKQNEKLFLF